MDKVAGLQIQIDAKDAKLAAESLATLVTAALNAEMSLKRLKSLSKETAPTIRELGNVVVTTTEAMDSLGSLMKVVQQATTQAQKSSAKLANSMEVLGEKTNSAMGAARQLNDAMSNAASSSAEAAGSVKDLTATTGELSQRTEEAKAQRDRLTVATRNATVVEKEHAAENQKLERRVGSLNKELERKENYLVRIAKRAFAAAAGVVLLNKAVQLSKKVFEVSRDMETLNTQLQLITGSAYGAAEAIKFLQGESDRLGLHFRGASEQFGSMVFSFQEVGIAANVAKDLFSGVGAAAATFGMSQADVNGILEAFVRMANKGRVSSEELVNQIGSRLPGAFSAAAKAMDTNTIALSRMMANGEVLAKDLIPRLADELNKVWGPGAEEQADTLVGATNRLTNAWEELLRNVGDTEGMKNTLNALTALLELVNSLFGDTRPREELEARKEALESLIDSHKGLLKVFSGVHTLNKYRVELAKIEAQLLRLDDAGKQRIEAETAEAEKRTELVRRTSAEVASKSIEMYARIDRARDNDVQREVRAAREIEREKKEAIASIFTELGGLKLRGLDEEFEELFKILEDIQGINPFSNLDRFVKDALDGVIAKTRSATSTLEAQWKADLDKITELQAAAAEEGASDVVYAWEDAIDVINAYYKERMDEMLREPPDLSGIRNSVNQSMQELQDAISEASTGMGALEGGGDNLYSQIFNISGAKDRMKADFEGLQAEYNLQKDIILATQATNNQSVEELEQQKLERMFTLNQDYAEKINSLEAGSQGDRVKAFGQFQDDILYLAQSGSKTMGKIAKGLAIANTIIKTYESAQNAFASLSWIPFIGPALGTAAAATAIAAGMARVQAIRSTNFSGAHERGGMIPSGSVGLVGEAGPELVRGPAQVTSARTTADRGGAGAAKVSVVVNNHSGGAASVQETTGPDGERVFKVLIERVERELSGRVATGGSMITRSLEGAYGLRRGMQ